MGQLRSNQVHISHFSFCIAQRGKRAQCQSFGGHLKGAAAQAMPGPNERRTYVFRLTPVLVVSRSPEDQGVPGLLWTHHPRESPAVPRPQEISTRHPKLSCGGYLPLVREEVGGSDGVLSSTTRGPTPFRNTGFARSGNRICCLHDV